MLWCQPLIEQVSKYVNTLCCCDDAMIVGDLRKVFSHNGLNGWNTAKVQRENTNDHSFDVGVLVKLFGYDW